MDDVSEGNKIVTRDGWNGCDYLLCEYDDDCYISCQLNDGVRLLYY